MCVKLLFDQNLSYRLVQKVHEAYPDSVHVAALKMDRVNDFEIWKYAKQNGYVIVTKDSDFNELCTLYDFPPFIIWLRLGNSRINVAESALNQHQKQICEIIEANQTGVIEISS